MDKTTHSLFRKDIEMKNLFIKNPNDGNVGFLINKKSTGVVTNSGPEGSIVIGEKKVNICLAFPTVIPPSEEHISKTIDLTGRYVVQVGDEIVPHVFNAEDLGKFFNEEDDSNTGVAFIEEKDMITCAGGTSYLLLPYGLSYGPWTIELGGVTVAEGLYDDFAVKAFFDANPDYGIVYELFSSGSGSGDGVNEAVFINNNLSISYPLKITGPNNNRDQPPRLNDTVVVSVLDNDVMVIEACLSTYAELKHSNAELAVTELTNFVDGSSISNDGLFLGVTFPNGMIFNGFLAAGTPGNGGRYEWDTIGIEADRLGYSIGIAFGGGTSTFNGGTLAEGVAGPHYVYLYNYGDVNETWHIIGTNILGIFDVNGSAHNGGVANGVGDYSVTLGPYTNMG